MTEIVYLFLLLSQFGDEYLEFCVELALKTLKQDRFIMDASKIKRDETTCDEATAGVTGTCQTIANLFRAHDQMFVVCSSRSWVCKCSPEFFSKALF